MLPKIDFKIERWSWVLQACPVLLHEPVRNHRDKAEVGPRGIWSTRRRNVWLLAWKWKKPQVQECRWPLKADNDSWITARKDPGALVLQSESCILPTASMTLKAHFPRVPMGAQTVNTLIPSLQDHELGDHWSPPRLLNQNQEVVNGGYFKLFNCLT